MATLCGWMKELRWGRRRGWEWRVRVQEWGGRTTSGMIRTSVVWRRKTHEIEDGGARYRTPSWHRGRRNMQDNKQTRFNNNINVPSYSTTSSMSITWSKQSKIWVSPNSLRVFSVQPIRSGGFGSSLDLRDKRQKFIELSSPRVTIFAKSAGHQATPDTSPTWPFKASGEVTGRSTGQIYALPSEEPLRR